MSLLCPRCGKKKAWSASLCKHCYYQSDLAVRTRFMLHVVFLGKCWVWVPTRECAGKSSTYGRFMLHGKYELAHRVSYLMYKGPIPKGKEVCHSCDNPKCVNPKHLHLGTHKKSMREAVARGRHGKGISISIARKIRFLKSKGMLQKDIALIYKISAAMVSGICTGKEWQEESHENNNRLLKA